MSSEGGVSEVLLGRQPIVDGDVQVVGYELLYRGAPGPGGGGDGDLATAIVAVSALLEVGLDDLLGSRLGFVNLTRRFLVEQHYRMLPPGRVMLEILEDVEPDAEVVGAVRRAKDEGYGIALDDYVYRPELAPLVELADVVKVDLPQLDEGGVARHAELLRRPGLTLLAEKVETHRQFELCRAAGYDWFQGWFFCRPRELTGRRMPTQRIELLRLMARIQDPRAGFDEIAAMVEHNVALSYRLLRYVNSAFVSLSTEIRSIRHAVVLLGLDRVRTCVLLLLLSGLDDKPHELLMSALVRARLCQLIAPVEELDTDQRFFTVGLLSVLDALMDQPMERLLSLLPLEESLRHALLAQEGLAGEALAAAVACERSDWARVIASPFPVQDVYEAWLAAVRWTSQLDEVLRKIDEAQA